MYILDWVSWFSFGLLGFWVIFVMLFEIGLDLVLEILDMFGFLLCGVVVCIFVGFFRV